MKKLCFASQNQHKIREIAHRLKTLNTDWEVLGLADLGHTQELDETQDTFEGNAHQKAFFVWEKYHTNCFADDSGLEVESLGNAPGVFSARYAGEQRSHADNISLLLHNLKDHKNRNARFRTIICLVLEGKSYYFDGVIHGKIIENPIGENGFGYDPIFVPDGYNRSFAQMSLDEKNALSHRSQAINKLVDFLKNC